MILSLPVMNRKYAGSRIRWSLHLLLFFVLPPFITMHDTTIAIDLAEKSDDEVLVSKGPDEVLFNRSISPIWDELSTLLKDTQEMTHPDQGIVVLMEATGMAWFAVSAFFEDHSIPVYRVKGQRTKEMRNVIDKYTKTDKIDARALAMLYYLIPDTLDRLHLPEANRHALKRWVKRRNHHLENQVAEENRLQSFLNWAIPGYSGNVSHLTNKKMREIIPKAVNYEWMQHMGEDRFYDWAKRRNNKITRDQTDRLYAASENARKAFGDAAGTEHYPADELEAETQDYIMELNHWDKRIQECEEKISEFNTEILSDKPLQSLKGTADLTEAVIKAFLGDGSQFPNLSKAECFVSYIPETNQTGNSDQKGTDIRKDGPDILKKFLYTAVDSARQWDPQIAEKYHKEMMEKGNPHTKAICNCVNKYLARILRILRTGEPYELRDCEGNPVSTQEAKRIINEKYTVPDKVRERLRNRAE